MLIIIAHSTPFPIGRNRALSSMNEVVNGLWSSIAVPWAPSPPMSKYAWSSTILALLNWRIQMFRLILVACTLPRLRFGQPTAIIPVHSFQTSPPKWRYISASYISGLPNWHLQGHSYANVLPLQPKSSLATSKNCIEAHTTAHTFNNYPKASIVISITFLNHVHSHAVLAPCNTRCQRNHQLWCFRILNNGPSFSICYVWTHRLKRARVRKQDHLWTSQF